MDASSTSCIARDACSSIVNHYSDPIHYTVDGDKRIQSAPYFDPILGQPGTPDLSPFCQVWYRRLLGLSQDAAISEANDDDSTSISAKFDAARELLCCYRSAIRPCITQQTEDIDADVPNNKVKVLPTDAALEILYNYELLITHLLRNVTEQSNNKHGDEHVLVVGKALKAVADDILDRAGNLPNDDQDALLKVQNFLLPYLLRLMNHGVTLIGLVSDCESSQLWKEVLAISTVISVPFVGDGRLKSGAFCIGTLLDWINMGNSAEVQSTNPLSITHTIQHCRPSPTTCDETLMSSDFATRSVVDFSVEAAQFEAPWTDGISGIGFRMGITLLKMIHQSLHAGANGEKATENKNSMAGTQEVKLLLCEISQGIGAEILSSTIRAFFYGRLCFPISSPADVNVVSSSKGPFMPMIQRTGLKAKPAAAQSSTKELPHVENKLRSSSAAIMFGAMYIQPWDLLDNAFLDTMPIVLTLLDDVTPFNQAVGGLILLSVMKASHNLTDIPSFVERFHIMLTRSLGTAIQLCGREDATMLAVLCLAQSRWFKLLRLYSLNVPISKSNDALSSAGLCLTIRTAAAHVLDTVKKQTQSGRHDGGDVRISAALVAGMNPLLELLAEFPEAASTEIGRVGLSALLPLVGWRGMSLESRSIQIAALCGLIALMNGAYPIMSNHGTKVMVELVALLHRTRIDAEFLAKTPATRNCGQANDEVSTLLARQLALYTAAIALIVCGKGAEDVLNHVELRKTSEHVQMCKEIRGLAAKMKKTAD